MAMSQREKVDAEIAILGAGVVGNTIAFHLAERGADVVVTDRNFPLSGTSGSTQAWVWVHTKTPASYAQFSELSAELYPTLVRRIGDVEYYRTGGLAPIFNEAGLEHAARFVERYREQGLDVQLLDREEVLAREPRLSPRVLGATYSPIDGNVNPLRLVDAYRRAAAKHGARFVFHNPVRSIERGAGVFVLQGDRAEIRARRLVLAGGPWSREVGAMVEVDVPVDPLRGQILITEPLPPMLKLTLSGLRQTANGEMLIGYSKENAGFDRRTTPEVLALTAAMALRYLPALAGARLMRAFAGIRAMPEDELPILGAVPGRPGLYVAAMHSGITLSPLVGTLMAELLLDGETSADIAPYAIQRFARV